MGRVDSTVVKPFAKCEDVEHPLASRFLHCRGERRHVGALQYEDFDIGVLGKERLCRTDDFLLHALMVVCR